MSAPSGAPADQRGAVLLLVLVVLGMLALLGAASARHASQRWLAAAAYRSRAMASQRDLAAGTPAAPHANIDDGANRAP